MTVTLKLGARQLTLGTVSGIGFTHADRGGDIDLPGARGTGKQVLGKASMRASLEGTLSGASRFGDFRQLERIRMLGRSLKLESPELDTVAFLEEVRLRNSAWADHLDYSVGLKESLFKQINACDELTGWGEDGSGTVMLEDSEPTPREGD